LTTRRSVQYYQVRTVRYYLAIANNSVTFQAKARAQIDRLHKEDANSVAEWVRNLAKTDSVLLFKGVTDPVPDGSRVEADAFILIIQSRWQREVWESIGQNYFGTDGTHNVTRYEKTNLYTIMGRDEFGRGKLVILMAIYALCSNNAGVPISYMLASNGQQATHELYFQTFRNNNPTLPPYIIMDRDLAAFNAARVIYHDVKTLLCLFHLVSAWWKHIVVSKHESTWKLALRLSRATTQIEFDSIWSEIKANGPPNFVSYMEETWLRGVPYFVCNIRTLS
jgi:MULE transposase domain